MASGAFFNAQTALLMAPLVSSTASLVFGWDQHLLMAPLTRAEAQPHGNLVLPAFWRVVLGRSAVQVLSLLGLTAGTAAAAVVGNGPLVRARNAAAWYVGAAALAVGHLGFVPFVARRIRRMAQEETDDNVELQRQWLSINLVRTATTDAGAWVCALVAVCRVLGPCC
ncbi:hypothetical protein CDD82_5574 [Ophiocordyceps australis]|uniref:DUF1772 domain-containing protein n=1 Tax=Ophiocordyceps australis TaxID=1399860 RepID=A0A2C5ZSZ6_9HYPO|nr:hypothetical protein CDD82_5574 [Ophiocordyceps australis]